MPDAYQSRPHPSKSHAGFLTGPDRLPDQAPESTVLIARVGGEPYAVDIAGVEEIIELPQFRRVPNAPRHVVGVFEYGGAVVGLIDLADKFGVDSSRDDCQGAVVVVGVAGKCAGLLVDEVVAIAPCKRGAQTLTWLGEVCLVIDPAHFLTPFDLSPIVGGPEAPDRGA